MVNTDMALIATGIVLLVAAGVFLVRHSRTLAEEERKAQWKQEDGKKQI